LAQTTKERALMDDTRFDRVEPADSELAAVSAALDGEGPDPEMPSASAQRFQTGALALRRSLRVSSAESVPDFAPDVLGVLVGRTEAGGGRWRTIGAVAAAFVIGIATSAVFLLGRDLEPDGIAGADIAADLVAAQAELVRLDAEVSVVERGFHPSVPVRTYTGTLRYRSPEQLALLITDTTDYPTSGWLPNDVALVIDEDIAWRSGRAGCPVDSLPGCLGAVNFDSMIGRAPFSAGLAAPLDLVLPAGGLVDGEVPAERIDGHLRLTTTVAQVRPVIDAILGAGAFRQVHATDIVELDLDTSTLVLRRLTIRASATPSRDLWATTWGYDDVAAAAIFELEITSSDAGNEDLPASPGPATLDAGYRETSTSDVLNPGSVPEGFVPYRSGVTDQPGGGVMEIATWTNGRAWFAVRSTALGDRAPNPTAELVPLGDGVAYLDRSSGTVELYTGDRHLVLTGSLSSEELLLIATSLPVDTELVDADDEHAIPENAFTTDMIVSSSITGEVVTIVTTTLDGTAVTIRQQPGDLLEPPPKTDVVEVAVRSELGRYSATLGSLTWVEAGWIVELTARAADLDQLLAVAETLHRP
jgi:hypothetical protein